MICRLIFLTAVILALSCSLQGQTDWRPVALHPELGDTIDLQDRDRYGLYQSYEDFLWAVVLLAPDSTVLVKIASQGPAGLAFDTLRTTASLESMRSAMAWRIEQDPHFERRMAHTVRLYPVKGPRVVEGMLLAVLRDTLAVEVSDSANGTRWIEECGWVQIYFFGGLRMAVLPTASSGDGGGAGAVILGVLGGAVLGGAIGASIAEPGLNGIGTRGGAALLGGLVGGLTGAAIGSGEPSDKELYPERFERLEKYARYTGQDAERILHLYNGTHE